MLDNSTYFLETTPLDIEIIDKILLKYSQIDIMSLKNVNKVSIIRYKDPIENYHTLNLSLL
jgi:hypothetical protein